MYEFWLEEKLFLIIGLFQFGLILIVYAIIKLSKSSVSQLGLDKQNIVDETISREPKDAMFVFNSGEEVSNKVKDTMNNSVNNSVLSHTVEIAPELLKELKEISNDPAAAVDEAVRWWLRRRTLEVLDASPDRKYRVGLSSYGSQRSQQDLWND